MMYSASKLNKQGDNIQAWCTPFPICNQSIVSCPVLTVASWPAYGFLKRQVRLSGIPISWRIFQFIVICVVKDLSVINEAEVFLEFSWFFYGQFIYCWSLAWRILSITFLACEMNSRVVVWTLFGIVLLWDWNENWPFPVLWALLSFPNLPTYWVHIDFAFKWTLIPSTNWFLSGTFPNPCLSINTLPANQWAKLRVSCHSFLFPLSPSPLPCQMTRIELSASSIRVHLSLAYFVPLNSASTFWALLKLIPWLFWNPWAPLVV